MAIPLLAASMASVVYLAGPGVQTIHADDLASANSTADANLTSAQKTQVNHSRQVMKLREVQQQQFLKDHADASGNVSPEQWRKSVEQQQQMKVAPYIGAKPLGQTSKSQNN